MKKVVLVSLVALFLLISAISLADDIAPNLEPAEEFKLGFTTDDVDKLIEAKYPWTLGVEGYARVVPMTKDVLEIFDFQMATFDVVWEDSKVFLVGDGPISIEPSNYKVTYTITWNDASNEGGQYNIYISWYDLAKLAVLRDLINM